MSSNSANSQIKIFSTFKDLVDSRFQGNKNAFCWERKLEGDFHEIVTKLTLIEDITEVSVRDLLALQLSEKGSLARETILNDLELLTEFGALPSLNLLKCYERDEAFSFISTDVYSFHVDRSPIAADTFLCTYHGASSDILLNDEAIQKILIPEIRAELRKLHDGTEESFDTFLQEHFFDLQYQPKPNAKPINLGNGNLWRLAVDHPFQEVLPCIHRAPIENREEFRLLLIC